MKRVKFLWIFVLGLFLCGLVSANGLSIVGDATFTINKTYDENAYIELTIRNDEPFDFTNVGMDNPYITMNPILILYIGENRTVNATIVTNEDISEDIKIFGFYDGPVGPSNVTHNIDITYDSGPSKCDFSIIKGDSIIWHNLVNITNYDINIDAFSQAISPGSSSILQIFNIPTIIPFRVDFVYRYNFFDCILTVKDDYGPINREELDTKINIKVDVEYPPTNLEIYTLSDSYSMEFHETLEDIFKITNIGNKIAKDIHLNAEWFSFYDNDFDLNVGQSKNIGYVIDPLIYESIETNKTYSKNLTITGNFLTVKKEFKIFIKYAEIVNDTGQNATTFKDWLCENYPEFCEPQIIYKYFESGDAEVNVTYTENRVKKLYDLIFNFMDEQAIKNKQSVEYQDMMDLKLGNIENSTSGTNVDITNINDRISDTNDVWKFAAWIFGMIVTGLLLTFLALKYQDKFRRNAWNRYG